MTKYEEAVNAKQLAEDIASESVLFRVGKEAMDGDEYDAVIVYGNSALMDETDVLTVVCRVLNHNVEAIQALIVEQFNQAANEAMVAARDEAQATLDA